jgi:hypothetical protein
MMTRLDPAAAVVARGVAGGVHDQSAVAATMSRQTGLVILTSIFRSGADT